MHQNNIKIVSLRLIYWAIAPISRHDDAGEGEIPELEFPGMDGKNSVAVKERVIRPFIIPWIHSLNDTKQCMIKDSFRYCLNAQMPDIYGVEFFRRLFTSIVPDFDGPEPIRLFFVWIWEELYGPEDYHTNDLSSYVVDNDTPYDILD